MQAVDPKTSPEALSLASYAIVLALLDALRDSRAMDQGTINAVIRTAMMGIGARAQSSITGAEAARLLEELIRRFPHHVVEPTSILVTRGAQRAKTNRLDAVGLLRVLALKVHGRSRRLPIIVVPSAEEEDALRSPGSLGRGRRSVPNGPVPPAADP
jgi:hypothetical protein